MKRLKIAFVLNRFYPEVGGAETNLYFQACELSKKHDVTVFTPRRREDTPAYEKMDGFTVYRLGDWKNLPAHYPNNKRDTLMGGIFFRILLGGFDVVQAFPALNRNNMLALMAAKLRGIPYILTMFDLMDYAEIERKTGFVDESALKHYAPGTLRRQCLTWCSHIFAISNREIAVLKKYNDSVSFSPVPIRPEEYDIRVPDVREKYGIAKDGMLFLALGRVSRLKGQDLAVKAFIEASQDMPMSHLVIVGRNDYEPQLKAELEELIKSNQLSDRITFTGMVEREDVIGFLKQSDIHVIPVRFMNSGAVVVESWAGGTPVIQSDAVDPNLVKPGENGYLFPQGDVSALASQMRAAYANRAGLPAMAAAGRAMVMRDFTYKRLVEIYEEIYAQVCK